MSTKALEKVARDMSCDYTPCTPETCRKHAALAELETIREAARGLTDDEVRRALRHAPEEVHGAMTLLASIAKEG